MSMLDTFKPPASRLCKSAQSYELWLLNFEPSSAGSTNSLNAVLRSMNSATQRVAQIAPPLLKPRPKLDTLNPAAYAGLAAGFPVAGIGVSRFGGEEPQSVKQCGFFTSGFALYGLAGRGAARLAGAVPGTPTRSVSPPQLALRCAVQKLERRYTMTAPSRKPAVKLVHGKATTTSLKVAEAFGKQHNLVLRAIANLDCSPEFRLCNFAQSSFHCAASGPLNPMQRKTKPSFVSVIDGCSLPC